MYEENGCFDPNPSQVVPSCNHLLQPTNSHNSVGESLTISMEELSAYHQSSQDDAAAIEIQLQNQLADIQNNNTHLIHQVIHHDPSSHDFSSYDQSNWIGTPQDFVDNHHQIEQQNGGFNMTPETSLTEPPNHPTSDLVSLFHLPRCPMSSSLRPNSSISFSNPNLSDIMAGSCVAYDPLFHLNLPPQPPLIRELYQSPAGYSALSDYLLGINDQREGNRGRTIYPNENPEQFDHGILEFTRDIGGSIGKRRGSCKIKPVSTERERRTHLTDRFQALKDLIPNPTKGDRASIVGDGIEYIKELLRTVSELKLLVEKRRCGRNRNKRSRIEDGGADDLENKPQSDIGQSFRNNSLRSSWLQRKSKVTEVDVRIIDDEVNIKLVQKKKINCLLFVSKVLDQLQLELHHVAGGQIGEHYSFLFNTKIYEGSSVYASTIANTLIEVAEKQYMAALPTSSSY